MRLRVSDTGVGMIERGRARLRSVLHDQAQARARASGSRPSTGSSSRPAGESQIYSEPGVGTTFTVLLPATDQASLPVEPATESRGRRGEETILLVEDEDALRELTRRILAGATATRDPRGERRRRAAGGGRARGQIDLLLSDVIMPQMPGPQLAKRMLARQPSLLVLLMSGFAQPILDSGGHLDAGMESSRSRSPGPGLLRKIAQIVERAGDG